MLLKPVTISRPSKTETKVAEPAKTYTQNILNQVTVSNQEEIDTGIIKLTTNYNQNIYSLDQLFRHVNDLHDDYIRYFLYNNVRAGVRLRKKLNDLVDEILEIRREIKVTRQEREKEPFKDVKRNEAEELHNSEWD